MLPPTYVQKKTINMALNPSRIKIIKSLGYLIILNNNNNSTNEVNLLKNKAVRLESR